MICIRKENLNCVFVYKTLSLSIMIRQSFKPTIVVC